ncbi:MAG: hypothetical protein JWL77_6615 [Chthonomonadaceae bacterium]|nr:hypothetical protein [Chthonomonadaceae bacterium]
MTTGNANESAPGNSTAQKTRSLLRSIYRKRRPVWFALAIFVFMACLLIGLFAYPQSYTTTTSISLSQPNSGSSQLALLTGGGGGKAKYLGPLKSRRFAEQVEKAVKIQELYHLPTHEDAIEKLQRGVRFDDNATDGLLYITMSLDAPAKMAPNGEVIRKKVQSATADVCNAYGLALKTYIIYNDTDKESVLLRSAESLLKQNRADYDAAINKWIDFVRATKSTSLGMSGAGSSQSPEIAALQALFIKRGQLEIQIRSTDAAIAATSRLVGAPTGTITKIPTEDVLLTEARRRYEEAQHEVQDLRIQYADQSPPVLRAKERLKIAATHLQQQADSILNGHTSESIKRQALDVEYATVVSQIAEVEHSVEVSKASATSFEKLHAEVELRLKVLEATATRQAELKISTESGNNRLFVVDEARPPLRSRPGVLMTVLISLLLAILAVLAWFGIEYTTVASQLASHSVEPAIGTKQSEG